MATKTKTILHQKIRTIQLRSKPINYHGLPDNKIKELETRAAKIKVEEGQTAFYFCIWGVRDDRGTGWVRGAFSKSIKERGPDSSANQKIVCVWQHDLCDPIGRPVKIVEDEVGAYAIVEWDDPEAVPNSKRAQSQISSGTINGYSFGFDYIWDKMTYDDKSDTVWIKEADLYELSPVTFASMKETKTIRSKQDFENEKEVLDEITKDILSSLPRNKQLEIRQLITRHISLAKIEPDSLESIKKTLDKNKPKSSLIKRMNKQLEKQK